MKVLQINSVCGIGSTGRITVDLYHALKKEGHECLVAYGRNNSSTDMEILRIGGFIQVCIHALYSRITDRSGFGSKRATRRLIKKISEYKPDIIHLHNIHGYYINIALLFDYLRDLNIPVVWSLYDCWSFTGHCCHFDYVGCEKWKSGCGRCMQKKEYPATLFIDNSRNNYKRKRKLITSCKNITIVTPSKWLSGLISSSYLNTCPFVMIPSGIDLDCFKPTPSDFRINNHLNNKFIVLGVSSGFGKFKGSEYFIWLANHLPEKFQLVLIGVTKEQAKNYPEKVLTLPRTNSTSELAGFYSAADVFVNPTLQESQGLTNIEALACGTSVVTFNSGGSPECIDENCGFVVNRGDAKGLLEGIKQACYYPFSSEACMTRASYFDKKKLNQEYIKLYERIYYTNVTSQSEL